MPVGMGKVASHMPGRAPLQGKGISPSPAEKGTGLGKGEPRMTNPRPGQSSFKGKGI